jgi:hypothetical protein
MNALLGGEAKYKRALPSLFFGLCSCGLAQPDEPLRQQERDLVPALLRTQPLRRNVVGFLHRLRSLLSNAFDADIVRSTAGRGHEGVLGRCVLRRTTANAGVDSARELTGLDQFQQRASGLLTDRHRAEKVRDT